MAKGLQWPHLLHLLGACEMENKQGKGALGSKSGPCQLAGAASLHPWMAAWETLWSGWRGGAYQAMLAGQMREDGPESCPAVFPQALSPYRGPLTDLMSLAAVHLPLAWLD